MKRPVATRSRRLSRDAGIAAATSPNETGRQQAPGGKTETQPCRPAGRSMLIPRSRLPVGRSARQVPGSGYRIPYNSWEPKSGTTSGAVREAPLTSVSALMRHWIAGCWRSWVGPFQDSLAAKCLAMGVPANFSASRRAKKTRELRGR
jgi:hypothetical protein